MKRDKRVNGKETQVFMLARLFLQSMCACVVMVMVSQR